jgi:hypothetical protein
MAPKISKALKVDFKVLQINLFASLIIQDVGDEEYASE